MTQTPPEAAEALEAVTMIQADRDAAAAFIRSPACPLSVKMTLGYEISPLAEAFARYRIAHTRAQPSREEVARVIFNATPDRFMRWEQCLPAADAIRALAQPAVQGERERG